MYSENLIKIYTALYIEDKPYCEIFLLSYSAMLLSGMIFTVRRTTRCMKMKSIQRYIKSAV